MSPTTKYLLALLVTTALPFTAPLFTDGPLTTAPNLKVRTNENGYLRLSAGSGVTDGPLTNFGNIKLRTNENGYLRVSCDGCASTPEDDAYDASTWNGDLDAASKNAIRDKIEAIVAGGGMGTSDIDTCGELATILGTDVTGTCGKFVLNTSPTLVTPILGVATGTSLALGSDPADAGVLRLENAAVIGWEASPAGTDVTLTVNSSEQFVFSAAILSPTFVTPVLGTPSSGTATNITGLPAGGLTLTDTTTNDATTTAHGFLPKGDNNVAHCLSGQISWVACGSGSVSDTVYGVGWDADTTNGASKNALYDKFELYAGESITFLSKTINGANNTLTVLAASQLLGFIPVSNICTATNADNTHFLRGDCTWQTIAGGGDALVANPLSQFASTTSAELAGVLSNETGTSLAVFNTSPTLVTPLVTGIRWGHTAKTADYTVLTTDHTIEADATGTSVTVTLTLPTAASVAGREFTFVRTDADADGLVVLDGNSSETIDGAATYSMPFGTSVTIESNGTNWIVTAASSQVLSDPGRNAFVAWNDATSAIGFPTGISTDFASQLRLGVDSTTAGTVKFWNATSGSVTLSATTGALGTVAILLPAAAGTVALNDNTKAFTNTTYDVEATGNVFTTTVKWMFNTGVDQGGTASLGLSCLTALCPTATALTGTNVAKAWARFPDSAGAFEVQGELLLPADWTGALDINGYWRTAATSGDIKIYVTVACSADAEVFNDSWVAAGNVVETAKGTTLQLNAWSISSLTTTLCSAGELMHWRVYRDRGDAADSLTGTWDLGPITFTARRAQ